jgi:hypothetical protein
MSSWSSVISVSRFMRKPQLKQARKKEKSKTERRFGDCVLFEGRPLMHRQERHHVRRPAICLDRQMGLRLEYRASTRQVPISVDQLGFVPFTKC